MTQAYDKAHPITGFVLYSTKTGENGRNEGQIFPLREDAAVVPFGHEHQRRNDARNTWNRMKQDGEKIQGLILFVTHNGSNGELYYMASELQREDWY